MDYSHNNPLAEDLDHVLAHTRELWEELRGENVFISGGTGFFGCWLLESLLWADYKLDLRCSVTVLSRSPDSFRVKAPHLAGHPSVTIIQGSAHSFDFPGGVFSHVIHAATETNASFEAIDPLLEFESNVEGTRRMLEFARQAGTRRFLFTSSGAVYGRQPPTLRHLTEDYAGAPGTTDLSASYGQSKRVSEFLCTAYAHSYGFQALIARCFAFAGPGKPLHNNMAIGNFILNALNSRSIRINGDGTPYRSYLYASDLAIWLWTVLFRGASCHPYNVGSDEEISIAELAHTVKMLLAPEVAVDIALPPVAGKPAERYVPSIERCKLELGLRVRIPLAEAIRRTARWNTSYL